MNMTHLRNGAKKTLDTKAELIVNQKYFTTGEYRRAGNDGINARPAEFKVSALVGHGTNFESALKGILNANLQLVPQIRQFELQGSNPTTGEASGKSGATELNRSYVSTSGDPISDFSVNKQYATRSSDSNAHLNEVNTRFATMPVVIWGDGVGAGQMTGRVGSEVPFQRVNMRVLAFKDTSSRDEARRVLQQIGEHYGVPEIAKLRLATFDDLDGTPSKQSVWDKAVEVGSREADF
ncbi:hypothetical protein, partial [Paraburkholderia humisilvae]